MTYKYTIGQRVRIVQLPPGFSEDPTVHEGAMGTYVAAPEAHEPSDFHTVLTDGSTHPVLLYSHELTPFAVDNDMDDQVPL